MQVQLRAVTLDQKRNMARHQPGSPVTGEQAEIESLDMLDQDFCTRFGEGGRQINHAISSYASKEERRAAPLRIGTGSFPSRG
jgi:hypothetical protein